MNVDADRLIAIIGDLEVTRRVFAEELDLRQARIDELEQEITAFKDVGQQPTPISAEIESNAEDNLQVSQD